MVSLAPATYHWCVGSWSERHVLPALEAILKGNCRWSMHVYAMFREGECTTTAYVNMQVDNQKSMEYITLNMSNCTTICKTGAKTPQNHRSNTNAVMFNWYVHQKTVAPLALVLVLSVFESGPRCWRENQVVPPGHNGGVAITKDAQRQGLDSNTWQANQQLMLSILRMLAHVKVKQINLKGQLRSF